MSRGLECWLNVERHFIVISIWILTQEGNQKLDHSKKFGSVCMMCVHFYSWVRRVSEVSCNGICWNVSWIDHITKPRSEARPGVKHVKVWIMVYHSSQEDCKHHQEFAALLKIIRKVSNKCGNQYISKCPTFRLQLQMIGKSVDKCQQVWIKIDWLITDQSNHNKDVIN